MLFRAFVDAPVEFARGGFSAKMRIRAATAGGCGRRGRSREMGSPVCRQNSSARCTRGQSRDSSYLLPRVEMFAGCDGDVRGHDVRGFWKVWREVFRQSADWERRVDARLAGKTGAAHQQNSPAAGFDLFNLFDCGARPVCGREIDARRNEINQVMRDTTSLGERNFCRWRSECPGKPVRNHS